MMPSLPIPPGRPSPSLLAGALAATLAFAAVADDRQWTQWGGPGRDFSVEDDGLATDWPEGGPPVLWQRPLGLGHSAITVAGDRLFTQYRPVLPLRDGEEVFADEEAVVALAREDGTLRWEYRYPSAPQNFRFGAGPHSTPLVVGERLFAAGTNKQLLALDAATGELLWQHDLVAEYDAPPNLIRPAVKAGFAPSPLAWKDTVILPVGGEGQAVMAFRQEDGEPVWRSGDFLIAPASPILIELSAEIYAGPGEVTVERETQLVVLGGETVNGLDPDTGTLLWSHEHPTRGDMNNMTPVFWPEESLLFLSSAYDGGSRLLELEKGASRTFVDQRWYHQRLQVMFGNAVRFGPAIIGSSGDFGPAFVVAIHVDDGRVLWLERGFGRASFVKAGDKLLIFDEDGTLAIAEPTVERLGLLDRATVASGVSWTVPTLVGTTLYLRDRESVKALDLGR